MHYLWSGEETTEEPGKTNHGLLQFVAAFHGKGPRDGQGAVQADHHHHEGWGIHGEQLQVAEDFAEELSCIPLHCDIPHSVQWHDNQRLQQVGQGQMFQKHLHSRDCFPFLFLLSPLLEFQQKRSIKGCGEEEKEESNGHSNLSR